MYGWPKELTWPKMYGMTNFTLDSNRSIVPDPPPTSHPVPEDNKNPSTERCLRYGRDSRLFLFLLVSLLRPEECAFICVPIEAEMWQYQLHEQIHIAPDLLSQCKFWNVCVGAILCCNHIDNMHSGKCKTTRTKSYIKYNVMHLFTVMLQRAVMCSNPWSVNGCGEKLYITVWNSFLVAFKGNVRQASRQCF